MIFMCKEILQNQKILYFFLGEKSVITVITDFSPIHDINDFYILIYYFKIVRLTYLMRVIFLEWNIISHDTNNRFNLVFFLLFSWT